MIPKIIHYCWLGGNPLPEIAINCIETWKKYCPDYEIKEWNETNYDFSKHPYMKGALESKKWGFVPDYARLDIVYQFGGIYLDTDVEVLKSFDDLLKLPGFAGMEVVGRVNLGQGFGAEPKNETILKMRDAYDSIKFINDNDFLSKHASPVYQTKSLLKMGMKSINRKQKVGKLFIFPTEYFCPKNIDTGEIKVTSSTYSIHHFDGSWADQTTRYGYHLKWKCINKYGHRMGRLIYYFKFLCYIFDNKGWKGILEKIQLKLKN